MSTVVGNLRVMLTAYTKQFRDGIRGAGRSLGGFRQSIASTVKSMVGFRGTMTGLVAGGGLGYFIKSQMDAFDALAKTSRRLGIQAERLQELHHAAKLSGIGVNTLNMALQRMTRRLAEASHGTGESVQALKELGLDAVKLAKVTPEKALMAVADALDKVKNHSDKVRLAFKLFDSEGVALLQTLEGGSKTLKQAAADLAAVGGALKAGDLKRIEELNDSLTRMKQRLALTAGKGAVGAGTGVASALEGVQKFPLAVKGLHSSLRLMVASTMGWTKATQQELMLIRELNKEIYGTPNPYARAKPPEPAKAKPFASDWLQGLLKAKRPATALQEAFLKTRRILQDMKKDLYWMYLKGWWWTKTLPSIKPAALEADPRRLPFTPAFGTLETARLLQGVGAGGALDLDRRRNVLLEKIHERVKPPQPLEF